MSATSSDRDPSAPTGVESAASPGQPSTLVLQEASQWFVKVVLPMLRRDYPGCLDWAIALVSGSYSFGKADAFSDFDGRVYLPDEPYRRFASALSRDMEACARPGQRFSYAVLDLDEDTPLCRLWRDPSDREAWLAIDEGHLYYVSHWLIVYDPNQVALSFKKKASYYPQDVFPVRARHAHAGLLQWAGLTQDAASRSDSVTACVGMGAFLEAAMRLGFLLRRRYSPWAKWMYDDFLSLPGLADDLGPTILGASQESDLERLAQAVQAIEAYYHEHLPARLRAASSPSRWQTASEPSKTQDWQEQLAWLWYVLWEWCDCNLHKAVARGQEVTCYLYLSSTLLKSLYFGFHLLQREWPELPDLYRDFCCLPDPVQTIVPLVDELMGARQWPERRELMGRILSIYRDYMGRGRLLPARCIDAPVWIGSWLERRKAEASASSSMDSGQSWEPPR